MSLRDIIESACACEGCTLDDLTVMSGQLDPYRIDTPAHHRRAEWIAERVAIRDRAKGGGKFHVRGLHYSIVKAGGVLKPNGKPYLNEYDDWAWLKISLRNARWLGYVDFDRVEDHKNSEPVFHRFREKRGRPNGCQSGASVSLSNCLGERWEVSVPDVKLFEPGAWIENFGAEQPYALVHWGEKTSLEDIIAPIAERFQADLYLSSGDASDDHIYRMAKDGHADGRPLVVFTFSDCDPQGYWMPAVIARKLQAHRDREFAGLRFKVVQVGVKPEQVSSLGLISTPLKESESRRDRWRAEFNVDQTEIGAMVEDHPEALRQIAIDAIKPYYDVTLLRRAGKVAADWSEQATKKLNATDPDLLTWANSEADAAVNTFSESLDEFKTKVEQINYELHTAHEAVEVPPVPPVPEPELPDDEHEALVDFDDDFIGATKKLMQRKAYGEGSE